MEPPVRVLPASVQASAGERRNKIPAKPLGACEKIGVLYRVTGSQKTIADIQSWIICRHFVPFEAELAVAGLVGSYLSAWALAFSWLAGLDTVTFFDTLSSNPYKTQERYPLYTEPGDAPGVNTFWCCMCNNVERFLERSQTLSGDWSFLDGFYFCIVTLTTVGLLCSRLV